MTARAAVLVACALAASACGRRGGDAAAADSVAMPGAVDVVMADTTLVAVLADVHLLEARRTLVDDSMAEERSLRQAILKRRGYDSTSFARALADLADDETRSAVTWLAVQDRIDALQRVLPLPDSATALR